MPEPQFTANSYRFDPYRNFKFRVKIDGEVVAGINKVSALKKSTEVVTWREGGDPSHERKLPGQTSYDAITLEAGLTHDPAFEEWANLVNNYDGDGAMSLENFRKNLTIEVLNLQGERAFAYNVYRCWVSEYQAAPEMDAGGNAVAIRTIKLEHEGWERDESVEEPTQS
ncbi:MAG: phage tail protein [Myxococcota bacterium]